MARCRRVAAASACLSSTAEPSLTVAAADILSYVAAELWLRRWEEITQRTVQPQRFVQARS